MDQNLSFKRDLRFVLLDNKDSIRIRFGTANHLNKHLYIKNMNDHI